MIRDDLDVKPIKDLLVEYKTPVHENVCKLNDMTEVWHLISKLGDGVVDNLFKAQNKKTRQLAAVKMYTYDDKHNLADHIAEIGILSRFRNVNVVNMFEAYSVQKKLCVS